MLDDVLISRRFKSDAARTSQETPAQMQKTYLDSLRIIEGLMLEQGHHWNIGVLLTSQFPLTSSGNSQISRLIKNVRQNVDAFVAFQSSLRDVRTWLSSFTVGSQFQVFKEIYRDFLENVKRDSPGDTRINRPYLMISFSNNVNQNFKVRQYLYNLNSPHLSPFTPPAIINSAIL